MMKKIIGLVCLMFAFSIITPHNKVQGEVKREENFSFSYNDIEFLLGETFSQEKYGKELEYSELSGISKTYLYDHYEISTATSSKSQEDKITSIYFLDKNIETEEGIKFYDEKNKMIEVYGEDYRKEDSFYIYQRGTTELKFLIERDKIVGIEYVYVGTL